MHLVSYRYAFALFFILLLATDCFAKKAKVEATSSMSTVGYTPGIGLLSTNLFKITNSDNGAMSLTGHIDIYAYHKVRFGDPSSLAIVPLLGVTTWFLTGKTADEGSSVLRYNFGVHLEKKLSPKTMIHTGPGILWQRISGDGRTLTLQDGNGTADFTAPAGSAVARMLYLDIGLKLETSSNPSYFLNLMLIDPLSTRRTIALMFTLERGEF